MALAVALRLEVLRLPFILDDFLQLAMRTGDGWIRRPPWDRYRLVSGAASEVRALVADGRLPWWSDPGLRIAPFRPLSSLEGALAYAIHGQSPVLAHAVSLGWLAALVASVGVLLHAVLPPRAAGIGILAYALSRAHGVTVAWIANRCALISTVFVALALHGYVRHREGGGPRYLWQALLCLALSLLSSEYSLGAYAFLLAYEAFRTDQPLSLRARSLALPSALLLPYALVFQALGHGARATTLYADPLVMPWRFVQSVLASWPRLATLALAPLPGPPTPLTTALGVGSGLALLYLLVGPGAASRKARWLGLGALLALFPVSVTLPQYRLLPVAEMGLAASLGAVVEDALLSADLPRRALAFGLGVSQLVLAPIATVGDVRDAHLHDFFLRAALAAPLPDDPDTDVVLLGTTQVFAMHYPPLVRRLAGLSVPRSWRVLSCTAGAVDVRRTGVSELELSARRGGLLDDPQASVYRDPRVPIPGHVTISESALDVTVTEHGTLGPSRARFRFGRSLDDPALVLLVAGPSGFRRVALPRGGELTIAGG